jgi:hypothetical protein
MSASIIIDQTIVNRDNRDIESLVKQDAYWIRIEQGETVLKTMTELKDEKIRRANTPKPTIDVDDFFFDDADYELPLPAGIKEKSTIEKFSGFLQTSIKSGLSSISSNLSLSTMNLPHSLSFTDSLKKKNNSVIFNL